MALIRKYWYAVVFFPFLIVAIAVNGTLSPAGAPFYSWILVGAWCTFTLYFGDNLKRSSEFNSPHNTFTFISAPIFVGVIYSFWGYFTTIWGTPNLFGGSGVWMSGWDLVFAFPYLLVGSVLLWKCFRKYDWVYVGSTSFKARRFGFMSALFFLVMELIFIVVLYNTSHSVMLPLVHETIDLLLLFSIFSLIIIIVYYGAFRRKPSIPRIAQRRAVAPARRVPATSAHTGSNVYSRASTGQNPNVRVVLPQGSTRQPFRAPKREPEVRYHLEQPRPATKKQGQVQAKPKVRAVPYDRLKPKAGVLSAEDFSCIFCFQHPKFPEDNNRGVVLCPNCRYPAHADEFRNWTKSSNLCSRCGHIISSSFRQRPEIISVMDYSEVIKEFYRRGGK